MKLKNSITILILAMTSLAFQACGDASINEGFTETDISTPSVAPGIQEGLCEDTETEFTFKAKLPRTSNYSFVKGNGGIIKAPDGTEYIEQQTKSDGQSILNEEYPCIMEVLEDGKEIIFTSISRRPRPKYSMMACPI